LTFAFRPGSVIVFFILYFKTAVTPEKGIENLRVAISANNTFGDFQAKDLVLQSEESTKPTTTTGIKGLGIPSINVRGLHVSSCSHSRPLSFFCSSLSRLTVFNWSINQASLLYIFLPHLFAVSRRWMFHTNFQIDVAFYWDSNYLINSKGVFPTQLKSRNIFKERNFWTYNLPLIARWLYEIRLSHFFLCVMLIIITIFSFQ